MSRRKRKTPEPKTTRSNLGPVVAIIAVYLLAVADPDIGISSAAIRAWLLARAVEVFEVTADAQGLGT